MVRHFSGYVCSRRRNSASAHPKKDGTLMLEFQQRVVNEQKRLNTMVYDLQKFIHTNHIFLLLPIAEQNRLRMQHHVMTLYNMILLERIANFGNS
jgi:hypothetical protein